MTIDLHPSQRSVAYSSEIINFSLILKKLTKQLKNLSCIFGWNGLKCQ